MKQKKTKLWVPIVIGLLVVALTAGGIAFVLLKDGKSDSKKASAASSTGTNQQGGNDPSGGNNAGGANTPTFDLSVPHEVTPPDAEAMLDSYGQILSKTPVADSTQVQSEAVLRSDFSDRGLAQGTIYAEYDMSGGYTEENKISSYSSEKHPMYSTYYVTQSNQIWIISSINGVLIAEPYTYNYIENDGTRVPVIVAETDSFYSYDGTTNTFFDFVPDGSSLKLVKVEKIDSETLESLTGDQLGG